MTLTNRLVTGSLIVIGAFVVLTVASLDRRLRLRLREDIGGELLREARLIGLQWRDGIDPDSLADAAGQALAHRVTLIGRDGRVVGDSEFDAPALHALENHASRPEVEAALASDTGSAVRTSPSAGEEQMYAAARAPLGVARVSVSIRSQEELVDRMQRDVLMVALGGTALALALAALFARSVTRPIQELRDDARAIAGGDLARRPSLAASGEVGELASAFYRLAEQLGARLRALEADDALLRALTESLNEGTVAFDAAGRVVHMNEHARRLLGVRDALPFPADRLPRDRILREALTAALEGNPSEGLEFALQDRTVALTARPLAGGGAVLALFDLTRVRRLEAVRRDFVANVSHELKTPLTIVGGFAETLTDESISPEQREQFARSIVTHARRMQRIVDDLLDLSRIESGGWHPNPVALHVDAVANDALTEIRARAEARGLALRTEIAADATLVYADPTALRQILVNLAENAVRHTVKGSVTLFARRDGHAVSVGVRDTG
ncbi:MAG TPA: histidine kinase dimerization/phospho-acceptor domain-containing protein, partial [Gemmatimonadaceae bacterium]|nr:histidine kinase dimerization/phospho-acceptor domain-containing protein [Gemmatimonadaceae bacterium]